MYRRIYTVPVDAETGRRLARIGRVTRTPLRRLVTTLLADALDRLPAGRRIPAVPEAPMTVRIADLPVDERPREQLTRHDAKRCRPGTPRRGPRHGTRGRNALEVARAVLADGLTAAARKECRGARRRRGQ